MIETLPAEPPPAEPVRDAPSCRARVLFLDHTAALGGAELYLLDAAAAFPEARVLLFEDGPLVGRMRMQGTTAEVVAGGERLRAVRRDGGRLGALRSLPTLVTLARRVAREARSADVLFANSQKALVVGAMASRWSGVPLVWNLHDLLTPAHFGGLRRRAAMAAARQATCVVVNSHATASAFVAQGGDPARVRVVYNGFEPDAYAPPPDVETLRDRLGVAGVPTVGVFSRIAPWKGQHVLLDALAELPGVHALVIGAPLFGEDETAYADRLAARAAEPDVRGRVHFLGHRDDVAALLHACDVVAHTSVAPEPFGRVIVEAMLAGRPVVATRGGGASEIVTDGKTGRLVSPGDAPELARAIRESLADLSRSTRMSAAGRASATARFGRDLMHRSLRTVVFEVCGGR